MAATSKDRFEAAINVIHSLPKDGPFQPSNEMMLTFYGYYKQATEGPCNIAKPSFWEVVKKAKWEAWHKLGNMEASEAMDLYVDELKKTLRVCTDKWNEMDQHNDPRIVEAMPQTGVVSQFMQTLGTFYELVDEEPPMAGVPRPSPDPTHKTEEGGTLLDMSEITESALKTYSHVEEDPHTAMSHIDKHAAMNGLDTDNTAVCREMSESLSQRSQSESEEEFCDTSDNPLQIQEVAQSSIPAEMSMQMSTPRKETDHQPRVHFAEPSQDKKMPNGNISPIPETRHNDHHVYVGSGFPYISKKLDHKLSDSVAASVGDRPNSQAAPSENSTSHRDFSSNNSSYLQLANGARKAEGGEEPEGSRPAAVDGAGERHEQASHSPSTTGSSQSTVCQSSCGRRSLLLGVPGGGGEDNSPREAAGPGGQGAGDSLTTVLARLQHDMATVVDRLDSLEAEIRQRQREERRSITNRIISWWPFSGSADRAAVCILVWPVIVHLLLSYIFRRRRRTR